MENDLNKNRIMLMSLVQQLKDMNTIWHTLVSHNDRIIENCKANIEELENHIINLKNKLNDKLGNIEEQKKRIEKILEKYK